MSAIAHLPGTAWAATHRAVVLVLTTVLVAAAVVLIVVLTTRSSTAERPAFPDLPAYDDACMSTTVGNPC